MQIITLADDWDARTIVVTNNCEHFATWCKTGHHASVQADFAKGAAVTGLTVLGVAAAVLVSIAVKASIPQRNEDK